MKKAMKILLSLVLVLTTLFSYTPSIIYAQEDDPVVEINEDPEDGDFLQEQEVTVKEEEETVEVSEDLQEESVEALPLTDEPEEEGAAGSFQVFPNVDGDIIIREQVLIDAAKSGYLDIAVVFDSGTYLISNGYNESRKYVNRYFSVEEDEQGEYILISHDDLLANYVPSGNCYFSAQDMNSNTVDLSACQKASGTLSAKEEGGELLIYGDEAFLNALFIGKYDNRLVTDASEYGSYLVIHSGSYDSTIQRIKDSGDGFDVYTSPFTYDEVEGALRISSNVLKGNNVQNSDTASIDFYAIGFEKETVSVDGGITIGSHNEKVPFTIEQNDQTGDIIINSENNAWLRSLIEVKEYNNAGTNTYGSSISLYSNGEYKMSFSNYYYNTPNFPSNTRTDLFYDEENDYVYVPFSVVKSFNLPEGTVLDSFYVNALGFGEYQYDLENDGISMTIIKGTEDAPTDVHFEESDKGDLLIYSENDAWLSDLCQVMDNYSNGIRLSREGFTTRNFLNSRFQSPLELNDGYVVLNHTNILNNEIQNGEWNVEITVPGYEKAGPYSIDLSHVCKSAPTDITALSNEFGDLIVSSSDMAWIEMMVDGVEEEGTTNRGRITVLDLNGDFKAGLYSGLSDYSFVMSSDHTSFTIPNDLVLDRGLCGGDYKLQFYNYGYMSYKPSDAVHFNEYVKHEDPTPEVSVSQNEDTLDLWITSSNSDWLKEMKNLSESEEWTNIDFGDASITLNKRYKDLTFVEENGVYKGFYISHEALLSNNISSSVTEINFPMTASYDTFWVQLDFELQACKKVPEGLKVKEDEEGIRFYFEETGEEERSFLEEMTHFCINDLSGEERVEVRGSHVSVHDENYEHEMYAQNNRTIYSNRDPYESRIILLSEDGNSAYIDRDSILENSTLINSDQKYNIDIYIYGYERYYDENLCLNGLHYAKEPLKENLDVHAQLDEQMNLIIRSNDETWLEALCKETIEGTSGVISRGSGIRLINAETDRNIYFSNSTYKSSESYEHKTVQYELRTDEQGAYIFISVDNLRDRFAGQSEFGKAGSKYTFALNAYGYEAFTSDPENENEYIIFPEDLIKETPELTLVENENGDIVISCENKDDAYKAYLSELTSSKESMIYFNFNNTGTSIEPYWSISQGRMYIENDDLIISNAQILDSHVPNGQVRFYFEVPGYLYKEYYLDLVHACEKAPDVEIEIDSDKNLVIRSGNDAWMNKLATIENGISFSTDSYDTYISGNRLTKSGDSLILKKEEMSELPDGNYWIYFNVSGYDTVSRSIELAGYAKTVEADIIVECVSGDLIITCDDTDYLKALMTPREIVNNEDGYSFIDGSRIFVTQGDWGSSFENSHENYNGREYNYTTYTLSGNKIKVPKQGLINRQIYNGTASVELNAKGYPTKTFRNIQMNNVCEDFIPDDLKVEVEENGDLTISSGHIEWLKALCSEESQDKSAGSISFKKEGVDYYQHSIFNSSRQTYLTYSNGKVTVARDGLIDNRIENGDYTLMFEPYKYRRAVDDTVITITKGVQPSPDGIQVRLSENGDIVIYSTTEGNEDFLKALTRWEKLDSNDNIIQRGSYIFLENENSSWNEFSNFERPKYKVHNEQIKYDESRGYAYIPRDLLTGISGEGYSANINAYGYGQFYIFDIDLPLITVASAQLQAGSRVQFFVNTDKKVTWSVSDERFAKVDAEGNLTALSSGRVYLSAQVEGNEYVDTIPVDVLPAGNVTISMTPAKADATVGDTLNLNVKVTNAGDYYTVDFVSSDSEIATVDENGVVTFLNPGVVRISASVFGKSATSTFTVYEVTKGTKLVASIEGYNASTGMEALDEATLTVTAGGEVLDPSSLNYTVDKEEVAQIDENGQIRALKSGSVKLTAALKDDPGKRSCTFTLKVYPRVLTSLALQVEDADGILMDQTYEDGVLNLYFNSKNALKKTIRLVGVGTDKLGNEAQAETLTFAPVDASIAKAAKDGTVSILKAGQTLIRTTVSSNPKGSDPVTCDAYVRVIDYAPRLESAKATLNKYVSDGTDVKIYAIASSSIKEISLTNSKTGAKDFVVTYEEGADHFNIRQSEEVKNEAKGKTYAENLHVVLNDGSEYDYAYSVSVSTVLPKTTVKATGAYNTVLDHSTLGLDVTVKTGENYSISFENDWAKMDEEGNIVPLTRNEKGEYILKGKVLVSYEGYDDPRGVNTFNISFKADKNLPTAVLSASHEEWLNKNVLVLNKNFLSKETIAMKTSSEDHDVVKVDFKKTFEGMSVEFKDGNLVIDGENAANGNYAYTMTPYISVKGELKALKNITLTVKVGSTLPKVSLTPATVKLNSNYHETAEVVLKITDLPAGAQILRFEPTALAADVLNEVKYEDGVLHLTLKAGAAKGSYKYALTPVYTGDVKGSSLNLTVSVSDALAKASISLKGTLNQFDPAGEENCIGTIKLSGISSAVEDIAVTSDLVEARLNEEGKVVFTLKKADVPDQTLKAVPVKLTMDTGDTVNASVNLKIARKAPVLKLESNTFNVYDTFVRDEEVGRVSVTGHDFGEIKDVWFSDSLAYRFDYDKDTDEIIIYLVDAANIKSANAKVTVKIDWVNDIGTYRESLNNKNLKGLKTSTLTLNIKDASNAVKAK